MKRLSKIFDGRVLKIAVWREFGASLRKHEYLGRLIHPAAQEVDIYGHAFLLVEAGKGPEALNSRRWKSNDGMVRGRFGCWN